MALRLPTHLESLIPPPSEQLPLSRPYRGTFTVNGVSDGSAKQSSQNIRITAVEIAGEKCVLSSRLLLCILWALFSHQPCRSMANAVIRVHDARPLHAEHLSELGQATCAPRVHVHARPDPRSAFQRGQSEEFWFFVPDITFESNGKSHSITFIFGQHVDGKHSRWRSRRGTLAMGFQEAG